MTNQQDATPELKSWLRLLRLTLIALAVVLALVAVCGLSIAVTNRVEGAVRRTAPGDCERVIALVFVHNSAGNVNIRPVPAVTGTALRAVSSAHNPHEAIDKSGDGKWWQLCETKDGEEWITANETWTIGVSVTPGPTRITNTPRPQVTPTRLVTNTPSPVPSATRIPTPKYVFFLIDVEGDGVIHELRCAFPCRFVIVDKVPQ